MGKFFKLIYWVGFLFYGFSDVQASWPLLSIKKDTVVEHDYKKMPAVILNTDFAKKSLSMTGTKKLKHFFLILKKNIKFDWI